MEMETVASVTAPSAVADFGGFPVYESWLVPRNCVVAVDPASGRFSVAFFKHPWYDLKRGYCPPFWTRNMLGIREAERDKRRYSA